MDYFGDGIFYNAMGIFIALSLVLVTFFKWRYTFWKRLGIPTASPSIPFGNIKDLFLKRKPLGPLIQDYYNEAKSKGYRHIGIFFVAKPMYLPIDPEIVKRILLKDFSHFMDRGFTETDEKNDPLADNLFNLGHEKWKGLRQKLSPTFTSGQLKSMFQTIMLSANNLEEFLKSSQHASLDIKDVLARYTTDSIGSCAFGLECNTMKNPNADFRKHGRLVFEQTFRNGLRSFIPMSLSAKLSSILKIKAVRPDVEKFFMGAVKDVVNYREKNNVHRKDFMDLLIQLKNHGKIKEESDLNEVKGSGNSPSLTMDELAAHAFVFYVAGFETSATTMTFALYELSQNHQIQDALRKEINTVLAKHNGKITYDAVMEMQYLQNVIDESLRMYPPVPFLNRKCTKDYQIPDTDIVLKKHTNVIISNLGLQRDPDYYPNPDVFDPDRFSAENKGATRQLGTHLGFGDGPRNCIGLRFGLLQTKIGIITILKDYKVTLSSKTPIPLIMDPTSFVLTSKHNIWLNVTKVG